MGTKHEEALTLAEELLTDIELRRLGPMDIARKTSRLARLTDDIDNMKWLYYEVSGFPEVDKGMDADAWGAAVKSNRVYQKESKSYARVATIGQLQANIDSANTQLTNSGNNVYQQQSLRKEISENSSILDRIVGSFHLYVARKYSELKFGAVPERIFESVRSQVDAKLSSLVPDALPILTTAFENINSDNPIQWNNATKACRDLIKSTADALRPPSKPKNGISMTSANYINRLIDWIESRINSSTMKAVIISDLEDLGKRLDALNNSGHKGTHSQVTKWQASRYIIGTYIIIGDILSLQPESQLEQQLEESEKPTILQEPMGSTFSEISSKKS